MEYDMIVVGAGCSGLSGAMYAGRLGMKVLVLGEMRGGTITTTDIVENYPGFVSIGGFELAQKLEEHAKAQPGVEIKDSKVLGISKVEDGLYSVKSDSGDYSARTILYATGTEWKKLGVKGEKEFSAKGVHYCALCDGTFYRNKTVAVIGGADSAAKDALVLSKFASKVYMIYRGGKLRCEPMNAKRVLSDTKIEVIYNTNVVEIEGKNKATGVLLDNPYNGNGKLPLDAVFVAIGHAPLSAVAKEAGVELDDKGHVKINRNAETNVPGFFAAGDITDTRFKQAIVGVGEAVVAAYSAHSYLESKKSE